ncbi:MAG: hypothetical protein CMH53_01115, partial [Myxococcales bacterium]|nr:hypothetical protein [Myxococcales bacterium]
MRQLAVTWLLCCVTFACSRDAKLDRRVSSSEATPIKELITGSLEHSRVMPSAKRALELAKTLTPTQRPQPVATPVKVRRAQGDHFAAATAHSLATAEAQAALQRGGNAVDALVAASVMLTVVTPHSTGIGGGGFAVVWPGGGKPAQALDFREEAPGAGRLKQYLDAKGRHVAKRSQRHGLAVGVPGYVAGLWALHKRWGKLPWASLFVGAIDVAHKGFIMSPGLLHATVATWEQLHLSARMILYPWHNEPPSKAVVLRQPQLSETLRAIAIDGPSAFYRGAVAKDIVETVTAQGGVMTMQDLSSYKPRWRAPLTGNAFGAKVLTMPQPSAGGPQLLAMAEFMAGYLKGRQNTSLDSIAGAHALVEAMRHSFELRLAFSGDPKQPATSLNQVYPRKHRRALLKRFDRKKATESVRIVPARLPKHINTSHVSIIDSQGMAVSSTHTVNLHFGSG